MAHHEPFKALSPIEWACVANGSLSDFLGDTFSHAQTLIDSIPLPQSVASAATGAGGRVRSATDPSAGGAVVAINRTLTANSGHSHHRHHNSAATAKLLHKEWREVKINPRDNALAINVYKLGGRDGKGAWFARRSVHEGITFEKFRLGLEAEFEEALKAREAHMARVGSGGAQPGPGTGKVRGIGAERKVESFAVEDRGKGEVFQLSAQFPGPTAPRDFITLFLTSSVSSDGDGSSSSSRNRRRPALRQFMVVSKPCVHPECPPRQGFIRGQYESVEIIREIPIEVPLRKVRSSIDITREEGADYSRAEQVALGREAVLRSARRAGSEAGVHENGDGGGDDDDDSDDNKSIRSDIGTVKEAGRGGGAGHAGVEMDTAIEWLMITRSDPGGSVPRFMIEKGTPAGIVSDAQRLLDWLAAKDLRELEKSLANGYKTEAAGAAAKGEETSEVEEKPAEAADTRRPRGDKLPEIAAVGNKRPTSRIPKDAPTQNLVPDPEARAEDVAPTGFYGMIAGALGVASSVVASRIPSLPFGTSSLRATDSEPDLDQQSDDTAESSDSSSVRTFSSAVELPNQRDIKEGAADKANTANTAAPTVGSGAPTQAEQLPPPGDVASSIHSRESSSSHAVSASLGRGASTRHHERDLRKLEERRRKANEKMTRSQEKSLAKRQEDKQRDEAAAAKLKEKHEREMARQEAKYQRELKKIEERRAAEARKAEERRRKLAEREERANLGLELDRARAERDVALKQIDILKDQIGELQSQNTVLVATLGRHGLLKGGGGPEAWRELKLGGGSGGSRSASRLALSSSTSESSLLLQGVDNVQANNNSGGSSARGSTKA